MYWSNRLGQTSPATPIAASIGIVIAEFSTGGSERIAVKLGNQWAASGRRVTIFCGSEEGPLRALVSPRVQVVPIMPRVAPGHASRAFLGGALADLVQGAMPDVIVGPGNYHVPILHHLACALPRVRPAIVCKISNPLDRPDRSRLKQAAFAYRFRRMTRRFDTLVAMSPALAIEAARVARREDIACAYEPIVDRGEVTRAQAPQLAPLVVAIGRLVAQKDFALAIAAMAQVRGGARLAILGEGDEYPALRARAEALGVADRVRFVGYVGDVTPWLAAADALLCTSRFEGYPAALVEALAAGLPVVTTPCTTALPEIMTDPSCGIVAPRDPIALADALETVLTERQHPSAESRARLRQRHAAAQAAAAWLAILDRAVAARGGTVVTGPPPLDTPAPAATSSAPPAEARVFA